MVTQRIAEQVLVDKNRQYK